MRTRYYTEKARSTSGRGESKRTALGALLAFQHVLLWSAAYVLASGVYMLVAGDVTSDLLPVSIVLMASVS